MELCQVLLEAHQTSATIYMVGILTESGALRAESIASSLSASTRTVRLDLRGIEIIDPRAFVRVARALNQWRDAKRGRLSIQFPRRSAPHRRRAASIFEASAAQSAQT